MSVHEGLVAWVEEALEPLGRVTMRKMMGGGTLYLDGTIFAITDDGELREATFVGVFYPDSEEMTYTVSFEDYGTEREITAP